MYKFYWNNLPKGETQSQAGSEAGDISKMRLRSGEYGAAAAAVPQVPVRNQNGVTVKVKNEQVGATVQHKQQQQQQQQSVGGSHRVLLKLRRMSGGSSANSSRPKSVSDASEVEVGGVTPNLAELRLAAESGRSNKSKMKSSKSLHQFHYNKTWNEKSLSKCMMDVGGQHNYENIYSSDKGDDEVSGGVSNYFDWFDHVHSHGGGGGRHPIYENVHLRDVFNNNEDSQQEQLIIGQLTESPRSSRSKRKQFLLDMVTGGKNSKESEEKSERKSRSKNSAANVFSKNPLYRSKSCERPKMRDAMKETFKLAQVQSNLNRLSSNITDRVMSRFHSATSQHHPVHHQPHHQQPASLMTHSYTTHNLMTPSSMEPAYLCKGEEEFYDDNFMSSIPWMDADNKVGYFLNNHLYFQEMNHELFSWEHWPIQLDSKPGLWKKKKTSMEMFN